MFIALKGRSFRNLLIEPFWGKTTFSCIQKRLYRPVSFAIVWYYSRFSSRLLIKWPWVRRHSKLIDICMYKVGLKYFCSIWYRIDSLTWLSFYKFKSIAGNAIFRRILKISPVLKGRDYLDIMRQTACLVINPIVVIVVLSSLYAPYS